MQKFEIAHNTHMAAAAGIVGRVQERVQKGDAFDDIMRDEGFLKSGDGVYVLPAADDRTVGKHPALGMGYGTDADARLVHDCLGGKPDHIAHPPGTAWVEKDRATTQGLGKHEVFMSVRNYSKGGPGSPIWGAVSAFVQTEFGVSEDMAKRYADLFMERWKS